MPAGTPFMGLLEAIEQYYGSGSDQWLEVAKYGTTADDFMSIVDQLPNYRVITNKAGNAIGYEAINTETVVNSASAINSNAASTTTTLQTPATVTVSQETGKVIAQKGVTGATGLQFIVKEVAPAVIAAGVGIKLGKTIDSTLYNLNPQFWDENGMQALDPTTWASITSDYKDSYGQEILGNAFNMLYGIDTTAETGQAYIDQNALAYMALYLQSIGVLTPGQYILPPEQQTELHYPGAYSMVNIGYGLASAMKGNAEWKFVNASTDNIYTGWLILSTGAAYPIAFSTDPFTVTFDRPGSPGGSNTLIGQAVTRNNITYYVAHDNMAWNLSEYTGINSSAYVTSGTIGNDRIWDIAYIEFNGEHSGAPEGIGTQPGATVPDLSSASSVSDALTILQTLYPDMFNNAVQYPVMQDDGSTIIYTYVPLPLPNADSATDTQPTGDGEYMNQTQTDYDPATMPDSVWDYIWDIINKQNTPVDDVPGDGETPAIVTPTGSASALWKIYNPSQSQLDDFGAWLWSSDFVDQLLKVFSDPMQAIIGLHKIFVTPPTTGSGAIKVGYLVSDASANYVTGQYVDVDCGSVSLPEYFGNVLDYQNTQVSIFLPFSGIHKLDVDDVMRGSINVIYHVDVLTGACLIDIKVTRDGSGGVLYTFTGNCAVQYPVSSGSYVGIVTGLLGMAGGIAGTIMSGGMLAPALMGVGASIGSMHTNIQHSGNISANAGAMGCKKPYLIIERGQGKTPPAGLPIEGLPQNDVVTLSGLTGHVRVKRAKYNGIPCTSGELEKIKMLLENGVYIS